MFKRIFLVCVIFVVAVWVVACGSIFVANSNMIVGSGKAAGESRAVSSFDGVVLTGSVSVEVVQADTESVICEAEENILPLIVTEVKSGKLHIGFKPNTSVSVHLKTACKITVKDFSTVVLDGSGSAEIGDLNTATFSAVLNGSGRLNLGNLQAESLDVKMNASGSMVIAGGVTREQNVVINGSGSYAADAFHSQTAIIQLRASGSALVWVETSLDANIAGSGILDYYGQPRVTSQDNGSGSVNNLGNH